MLTSREEEIVKMLARGYGYGEIAEKLGISTKTVEHHAQNMGTRFGRYKGRRSTGEGTGGPEVREPRRPSPSGGSGRAATREPDRPHGE
jgi:hypothetical protein